MQQSQGTKLLSEMHLYEYMVIFHIAVKSAENFDNRLILI